MKRGIIPLILFILNISIFSEDESKKILEGYNGFEWGTSLEEIQSKEDITFLLNDGVCDVYTHIYHYWKDNINDEMEYCRAYYFYENKLISGGTFYGIISSTDIDKVFFSLKKTFGDFTEESKKWNLDKTIFQVKHKNIVNENMIIKTEINLYYNSPIDGLFGAVNKYEYNIFFTNKKFEDIYLEYKKNNQREIEF